MQVDPVLTKESLIERVHSGFSAKVKKEISADDVRAVLANVHVADAPEKTRCHLRISRLSLRGEKTLNSRDSDSEDLTCVPIDYDQDFASGVNVLLIEDNDVGKSSIMKTIKFMLTGDDHDYDTDVAGWISKIRLQFSLGESTFTLIVDRKIESGDGFAVLCTGSVSDWHDTSELPEVVFSVADKHELSESLRRFFFDKLSLRRLSWTLPPLQGTDTPREAGTSWRTFFQALHFPDSSDEYLLCDSAHAIGNQEGLVLSSFLGLHLIDQLNELGVESSKLKKVQKNTESEREELRGRIEQLRTEQKELKETYDRLKDSLQDRRNIFVQNDFQQKLHNARQRAVRVEDQIAIAKREVADLTEALTFLRAEKAQIRELIDLKLHLTGLSVQLCPNCDSSVSKGEIQREESKHECRLCGKSTNEASPEEIEARRAEEKELSEIIEAETERRKRLKKNLTKLDDDLLAHQNEARMHQANAQSALAGALPSEVEEDQRSNLLQAIGQREAEILAIENRLEAFENLGANDINKRRILDKARSVLQTEAERRNASVLKRLSELTEEIATEIGTESITDISCSALGTIQLLKHGQKVRFTGIKNPGERLRVKLAFFLALMRVSHEPGMGRHPSFLLVDQPGSAEIVEDDFTALAGVLRAMDEKLNDQIQVICFTARPSFSEATRPERIYGPQSGKHAF